MMSSLPDISSKNRRLTPTSTAPNLRNVLSLPPKWIAMYDDFVTKNASQVAQMESALRSLTYIIPGRFRDAELATEGIHSGVQLLSLYHDILLFRASLSPSSSANSSSSSSSSSVPTKNKIPSSLGRSLHARYTRFWTAKSKLYRRVAIVLQLVQYTELLLEMWAKRRGEVMRWRVVVLIEAVKAFCRLLLLKITRSRPLVTPALPERERVPDPEEDEEEEEEEANGRALAELMGEESAHAGPEETDSTSGNGNGAVVPHSGGNGKAVVPHQNGKLHGHVTTAPHHAIPNVHNPKKQWPMPRTGLTLPSLPASNDISSYLISRVLTADDIKPATKLLQSLQGGSAHTAEILHILSPLIYAVALARTSSAAQRRSSWTPWLLGLVVQLAARQLAKGEGQVRGRTALEKEEWSRRGRAMWWWLMRGAAYEHVVKGVVGGVRRRVPGFVGTILEDYEYLWENYYFSTSDS